MPEKLKEPESTESSSEPTKPLPEPIRVVRRRIECPDGSTVEVDVPVYPPYSIEMGGIEASVANARGRQPASAKRLRKGVRPEADKAPKATGKKTGKFVEKKTRKG